MSYQLYNGLCHYAPSKENWTSLLIAPPPPHPNKNWCVPGAATYSSVFLYTVVNGFYQYKL